jgi:hypothetical protein
MSPASNVTRESWKEMLASAIEIFEDLERRDFGSPDVVTGGGTVLMFGFEHRLSKDIDFFMHDAQMAMAGLGERLARMIVRNW